MEAATQSLTAPSLPVRRRRASPGRQRLVLWATRTAIIVIPLIAWEWAVRAGAISEFFYGSPTAMWASTVKWVSSGRFILDVAATLFQASGGFVIAAVMAIPCGFVLGRSPFTRKIVEPFIDIANSTPRIALAPLFILWFGLGDASKMAVVVSIVFFIMLINTVEGVMAVSSDHLRLAELVGLSRTRLLISVILPSAVGYIRAGIRLSVPYALAGAVVGEMISSNRGLGAYLVTQAGDLNTSAVLAGVIVMGVMGWLINIAAEALLSLGRWNRP